MSASALGEQYEDLRRRATEGGPGRRDGLVVLHQQGLSAWVLCVATRPSSSPEFKAPTARTPHPTAAADDRAPLVDLCTEMLLANLIAREDR